MRVQFDVEPADALVFWTLLNDDEGLRESTCRLLLAQHAPVAAADMRGVVTVLGAISRAIALAPGFKGELSHITAKRAADIRKLAGVR